MRTVGSSLGIEALPTSLSANTLQPADQDGTGATKIARGCRVAITKLPGRQSRIPHSATGASHDGGDMRRVMWTLACAIALCGPATAVPARPPDLSTTDGVLRWINGYRVKPDLAHV